MKDYLLVAIDDDEFEHKAKIFCFNSKDDAYEFWKKIMMLYPSSLMLMNPIMVTFDNEADKEFLDEKFHEIYDRKKTK